MMETREEAIAECIEEAIRYTGEYHPSDPSRAQARERMERANRERAEAVLAGAYDGGMWENGFLNAARRRPVLEGDAGVRASVGDSFDALWRFFRRRETTDDLRTMRIYGWVRTDRPGLRLSPKGMEALCRILPRGDEALRRGFAISDSDGVPFIDASGRCEHRSC